MRCFLSHRPQGRSRDAGNQQTEEEEIPYPTSATAEMTTPFISILLFPMRLQLQSELLFGGPF